MQQIIECIIFIVILLFQISSPQELPTEEFHEIWKKFEKDVDVAVRKQRLKIDPTISLINSIENITPECLRDINDTVQGIINQKTWAFRMFDASAKLPSGILEGSFFDLGDYDECLAIKKLQESGEVQFTGQYCKIGISPSIPPSPPRVQYHTQVLNVSSYFEDDSVLYDFLTHVAIFYQASFLLGVCVPSTCSVDDLQQMMDSAIKNEAFFLQVTACEEKQPIQVSAVQIVSLAIILFLLVMAVLGTLVDFFCIPGDGVTENTKLTSSNLDDRKENILVRFLKCFSIRRNLESLFIETKSKEHFSAIDGLRACAMFWIVKLHSHTFSLSYGAGHLRHLQAKLDNVAFNALMASMNTVDVFFVISAFLLAYLGLKSLHKSNGRLDLFQFYFKRIWRIFPPLAGCLLVIFLLPLLGSGPLYKESALAELETCEKNWWQVLIMIGNSWVEYDTGCLGHTWYISSDMIYYLVSPIFLIALYRYPRLGLMMVLSVILASICTVGIITYIHDLYPIVLTYAPDLEFGMKNMNLIYYRPYTHAAPYFIGFLLGYIYFHYKEIKINKVYQLMGWCICIALLVAVGFSVFEWNRGNLSSKVIEISYAALHRAAMAVSCSWIIFMCITGRGGLLDKFLSSSFLIPISRLSFTGYLFHMFTIWLRNGIRRTIPPFQVFDTVYYVFGDFTMSMILSVFFYLLFEGPAVNLSEILLPKKKPEL